MFGKWAFKIHIQAAKLSSCNHAAITGDCESVYITLRRANKIYMNGTVIPYIHSSSRVQNEVDCSSYLAAWAWFGSRPSCFCLFVAISWIRSVRSCTEVEAQREV